MKLNYVFSLSIALLSSSGFSQTGGGAAGGTGGVGGTGAAGTATPITPNPGTRVTPQPLLPREQSPSQPINPNLPQQGQTSPEQNSQFVGTNAGVTPLGLGTNQLSLGTNQFGTNQLTIATNQFDTSLPATSRPGFTNRIMATNTPGLLTNSSRLTHDQALSEIDRKLLGEIRTAVYGSAQAPGPNSGPGVYFILRDGVVRLVGIVPNAEEQKRIENMVQQVPGVVRVYDALQIGVSALPTQTPTVPAQRQ